MLGNRVTPGKSVTSSFDLEQIFAASRSALCVLRGPEHRWEKVNRVYQDLIFPGIDLIGRTVREVVPDVDGQGFGALLDEVYATGEAQYGNEVRLMVHDRQPLYFNFVYAPIHDSQGAVSGIFVEAHDVTSQVLAREALVAAEANYRSIFEHTAEGIFRTSPDGRLLLVNPALARMVGYASPEEMLSQVTNGAEHLHAEAAIRSDLSRLLAHQDTITGFIIKARHKDGSFLWLSLSLHVLRNPDGSIRDIEGIAENVTRRQQEEEALRASEARYRTLVEHFPNGAVFLFDHELRYTLASGMGLTKSGFSPEMFEGKTLSDVFPTAVAARDEPHLRAALRGESTRVEVPLGDRTFLVHTVPVKDDHGTVVGGMVMTQDITERKRAEEHQRFLADASANLGATLDYNTIIQLIAQLAVPTLGDMCSVFMVAPDGTIRSVVEVNTNDITDDLDASRRQITLDPEGEHPVIEAIRSGQPLTSGINPSMQDHNSLVPPQYLIMPLVARHEVRGAILIGRNEATRMYDTAEQEIAKAFTDRAVLALEHSRLFVEAQDALRARDDFLKIAAHELKTPLTTLRGTAEVLQRRAQQTRDYVMTERDQQSLSVMVEQSLRLQQQIDTYLDLSQLTSGRLNLNLETLNAADVVERVVSEFQPSLERHYITLIAEPVPLLIQGDQLRLDQVLQNSLQNAVKYSPDGGEITVSVIGTETEICISVSDRGIGIPAAGQARLFERFYRVYNAGNTGIQGLGIGLAVVRDIVSWHKGRVEVVSEEGVGSTFSVWLPRFHVQHR